MREDEDDPRRGRTGVPADTLREIGTAITTVPQDFHLHRTIRRFLDNRAKAIETGEGLDWATAEALAFGSLLTEGHRVRLSGQDVERGTFSQRHSVVIDQENEERYTPLNHIKDGQSRYEVINSMLSEEAVLGFEYGYSLAEPNSLVLWEAQFGDFANGAQVVVDQFISRRAQVAAHVGPGDAAAARLRGPGSGALLRAPRALPPDVRRGQHAGRQLHDALELLPHPAPPAEAGLPQAAGADDPEVALRHKRAVSALSDIAEGSTFHRVLWDDAEKAQDGVKLVKDDKVRRVVLCSGKVYYDLYEEREKRGISDVYLMRVEQLYPFPLKSLATEISRFRNAEVVWCQEEPKNMGSWAFVDPYLEWVLNQAGSASKRPRYVGRPASASTAVGLMSKHLDQLQAFLNEALAV